MYLLTLLGCHAQHGGLVTAHPTTGSVRAVAFIGTNPETCRKKVVFASGSRFNVNGHGIDRLAYARFAHPLVGHAFTRAKKRIVQQGAQGAGMFVKLLPKRVRTYDSRVVVGGAKNSFGKNGERKPAQNKEMAVDDQFGAHAEKALVMR